MNYPRQAWAGGGGVSNPLIENHGPSEKVGGGGSECDEKMGRQGSSTGDENLLTGDEMDGSTGASKQPTVHTCPPVLGRVCSVFTRAV